MAFLRKGNSKKSIKTGKTKDARQRIRLHQHVRLFQSKYWHLSKDMSLLGALVSDAFPFDGVKADVKGKKEPEEETDNEDAPLLGLARRG